jgi:DNA primase
VARIKDASVDAVRAAADIVALASSRTQLRRSGARWLGRCPFHEERSPSFSVNPAKGWYHCFGCGAGGDAITFARETEQLDFVGAIEWLADRFNVPLEYEEQSPQVEARRQREKRLFELLDQAATFYERYLWEAQAGGPAREYLASRGLREEVCRELRLGLALGGTTLVRRARAKGFTLDELAAAGLANRRGNDYFSERLVFPLADGRGRVVGFQARRLREDDPLRAKYVNSPEGDLFRKGNLLYGLHLARTAISKSGQAYVVEGNTDVLALRQAGVEPVVASMGTALTEQQVRELGRLARRVYLCFDGDAAGEAATVRGMELAAGSGLDVRVVTLPPGLDPADAADGFEGLLGRAETYLGYRVRLELDRAEDRQEAFVRAREVLARFPDSPERQQALRLIADRLDLPKETQAGLAPAARGRVGAGTVGPKLLAAGDRLERDALAGVVAHPQLLRVLRELDEGHFDSELHRRARTHLLDPTEAPDAELVALLAELDARADREGIGEQTAEQALLRLRERQLRRELEHADEARLPDLQQALARVRTAFRELA